MTWFQVTDVSEAVVRAERARVWALLTDPDALVRMTPLLQSIDTDGDRWTWQLGALKVVGRGLAPRFTEQMTFSDGERIEFLHSPPPGSSENAGVDGSYELSDHADGTNLAISFTVKAKLPVPSLAKPAVQTAMKGVLATMGNGFGRNLETELRR